MSVDSQISRIESQIKLLPPGPLREHFEQSCTQARNLFTGSATTLLQRAIQQVEAATSIPSPSQSSLCSLSAALAIVLHTAVLSLDEVNCTGAHDTPPGSSFASPHRPVPPSTYLPPGWDADGGDSFHFRYKRHGSGRLGEATLYFHISLSPSDTLMCAASVDRSPHGGGRAETMLEIPLSHFSLSPLQEKNDTRDPPNVALAKLLKCLHPAHPGAWTAFQEDVNCKLLSPLLGNIADSAYDLGVKENIGRVGNPYPHPHPFPLNEGGEKDWHSKGHTPFLSPVMGIPAPLTGRFPGAFDEDIFPNPSTMVPGGFLRGPSIGGGGLVGPGHPLFGGADVPPLLAPPGVPPGARYDPIGPLPPRGGLGGRRDWGERGFPDPDHLRPPPWNNGTL